MVAARVLNIIEYRTNRFFAVPCVSGQIKMASLIFQKWRLKYHILISMHFVAATINFKSVLFKCDN